MVVVNHKLLGWIIIPEKSHATQHEKKIVPLCYYYIGIPQNTVVKYYNKNNAGEPQITGMDYYYIGIPENTVAKYYNKNDAGEPQITGMDCYYTGIPRNTGIKY